MAFDLPPVGAEVTVLAAATAVEDVRVMSVCTEAVGGWFGVSEACRPPITWVAVSGEGRDWIRGRHDVDAAAIQAMRAARALTERQ